LTAADNVGAALSSAVVVHGSRDPVPRARVVTAAEVALRSTKMAKKVKLLDRVPSRLQADYEAKRRPVAIRGAASHWPAVRKWTPAYLKDKVGHHDVSQISADHEELAEFSFGEASLHTQQVPP
jgi:hypothetical protein